MSKRGENIYKRKDGRWESRVLRGHEQSGKPVYAYFYGKTYKTAREKASAYASADNRPSLLSRKDTSSGTLFFRSVLDLWLERKKLGLKESSYVKYSNLIDKHIKPSLGNHLLTEVSGAAISVFIAHKTSFGTSALDYKLSVKTIRDIITIIKAVMRFAKDEGWLADIPNIKLTLPRESPREMRVLDKDEQAALEKYLRDDMDLSKLGILLCLYTGLRIGEICALKVGDIILDECTLTVNRTMQRVQTTDGSSPVKTKVLTTTPKSDCSVRVIPMPKHLIDIIKLLIPPKPDAYLLTGEKERYIEPRTYQNRFKTYLAECGVRDANFHSLRHTFATRCVEVGFEIKALSEILGHSNVNITLNRYVHPSLDMKRSNMEKLVFQHP